MAVRTAELDDDAGKRGRQRKGALDLAVNVCIHDTQMDDLEKGRIEVDNVKEKLVTAFDEKGVVHGIGEEEEALWCASCWNEVL